MTEVIENGKNGRKEIRLSEYDVVYMRFAVLIGVTMLIAVLVLQVIAIVRLETMTDSTNRLDARFRVIESIVLERQRDIQREEIQKEKR